MTARDLRLIEGTIVVLVGLLLAVATIHDVARQTHINHRLAADLATWRAASGRVYHNLSVEQDLERRSSTETVCGNVAPGGPDELTQLCLVIEGRIVNNRRSVSGGYYLPPKVTDGRSNRYGCFGAATAHALCGLSAPPPGAPPAQAVRLGRP